MNKLLKFIQTTILILILIYSIYYFHEIGHYIAAKLMGFQNVTMQFTQYYYPHSINIDDYEIAITNNVTIKLLISIIGGILLGLIPILFTYFISTDSNIKFVTLMLFIYYIIVGCSNDWITLYNIL